MKPNNPCRTIAYRNEGGVDTSVIPEDVVEGKIHCQTEENGEAPEFSKFEACLRKPSDGESHDQGENYSDE